MNIEIRKHTPIVKLLLQSKFWTYFEQEFIVDTWFTWYVLFHNSNEDLLAKIRKLWDFTDSKWKILIWNWEEVSIIEWRTIFNINNYVENVEFVIIKDVDTKIKFPVIWMQFLEFFKSELNLSFKKWTFNLIF